MSMNYNPRDKDDKKASSNDKPVSHAGAIGGLIFIFVLVFIVIFFVWYQTDANRRMDINFKNGCEPSAWNNMGIPTIYNCPVGVKLAD